MRKDGRPQCDDWRCKNLAKFIVYPKQGGVYHKVCANHISTVILKFGSSIVERYEEATIEDVEGPSNVG